jgi:hypothetical protein
MHGVIILENMWTSRWLRSFHFISYTCAEGETKGYTLDGTEGGAYLGGIKYLASSTYAAIAFTYDNKAVCWGSFSMIGAPEPQFITYHGM